MCRRQAGPSKQQPGRISTYRRVSRQMCASAIAACLRTRVSLNAAHTQGELGGTWNHNSSPETSAFRALRAVRILPGAPRLLMSSCNSASGIVNQRPFGARGLSMRGETIHGQAREGRPDTRPRQSAGPPRETFAHATPCRKTAYARRKTRTPRPGGQGVHSSPAGAPVSRAPLEVGRAGRVSNKPGDLGCREGWMTPRGALESGF